MTTIAFKDGVMAADTGISSGGINMGFVTKPLRVGCWLVGISGDFLAARALLVAIDDVLQQDAAPPEFYETSMDWMSARMGQPDAEDFDFLLAHPKHGIWTLELMANGSVGFIHLNHTTYTAIGSGRPFALGSMFSGASSGEAVAAAMAHDPFTTGNIEVFKFA